MKQTIKKDIIQAGCNLVFFFLKFFLTKEAMD